MPVHDYVITNATGATIRADLNNALSAIVTNNSSNSEPATKYAYMWWADTSAGLLKIRNSSNDGWVTLFQLDGTLTLEDGSNSAPAIGFRDDDNTGIFSSAADNLDITTGGTTRVNVSSAGINVTGTVTDDGASHDGDVTFIGASANINFDKSANALEFADTSLARFGNSNDLAIWHSGSQSFIQDAGTGGLFILGSRVEIGNSGGSESGLVFTQNGSVDLYHNNVKVFETTSAGATVTGTLRTGDGSTISFSDNVNLEDSSGSGNNRIKIGNGDDLQIYHDGSHSHIFDNGTGDLRFTTNGAKIDFQKSGGEVLARFHTDGAVDLYYDGTKRFETTSTGIKVTGTTTTGSVFLGDFRVKGTDDSNFVTFKPSENLVRWHDNDKAVFGGSNDLEIYHNGTNSIIKNSTNTLFIAGDAISLTNAAINETYINGISNGAVKLYFDDSTKLETTSTGVDVTSRVNITGANEADVLQLSTGNAAGNTFAGMRGDNEAGIRIRGGGSGRGGEIELAGGGRDTEPAVIKFSTTTGTSFTERMKIDADGHVLIPNDNKKLQLGASQDLEIYHDGTHSYLTNTTGDLRITDTGGGGIIIGTDSLALRNSARDENYLTGNVNGAVELYYDNTKRFETLSDGVNVTGTLKINGSAISTGGLGNVVEDTTPQLGGDLQSNGNDIDFADNDKAIFGTGSDLELYHDGTDSHIRCHTTGSLINRARESWLAQTNATGAGAHDSIKAVQFGGVELYYSGTKKFESTSFGCTVQGGITFGSDTAAANQFDDYEEGVFTPSLEFGGATTGITYSSMRGGSYTKIGRQVTVNFGFTLTSKGSASGDATIAGLPFAIEDLLSATTAEASGVSCFWNDIATNSANIVFVAMGGTSELEIRNTVGAEDDTDTMVDGDFENNTAIRGSITYFTAT